MSSTPNRKTVLQVDIPEVTQVRRTFSYERRADVIAGGRRTGRPAGIESTNVAVVGGDALILSPKGLDRGKQTLLGEVEPISAADGERAGLYHFQDLYKAPDGLGIGGHPDLLSTSIPAMAKKRPQGQSWESQLSADVAALPPPPLDSNRTFPLDRIFSGNKTYPSNTPFTVLFAIPHALAGMDEFVRFYFGGETDVEPAEATGGQFCLSIRGTGKAVLYEYDPAFTPSPWRKRHVHQWSKTDPAKDRFGTLTVIPYGRNRLHIRSSDVEDTYSHVLPERLRVAAMIVLNGLNVGDGDYSETRADTGHSHLRALTGTGTVRLDLRRDLRAPVGITRHHYPESGTLYDAPFATDGIFPAETPLEVLVDAYLPPGTSATGTLYDADTHTALTTNSDGHFLSVEGQTRYYAKLELESEDGLQTPVVWGYAVEAENEWQEYVGAPLVEGDILGVDITGPDTDPSHELALLEFNDPGNALELLRSRDGIRCRVTVVDPATDVVVSHLMEGETQSSEALLRGHPGDAYPVSGWREFPSLRLGGLWTRLAEQFALGTEPNFGEDRNAPEDANGKRPPWKVTDIIRFGLHSAGFRDDEIDIPDLPIRLFGNREWDAKPWYKLAVGVSWLTVIQTLAWDYLRHVLVRDPNAGPRGMWRLLENPQAPYENPRARFLLDMPIGTTVRDSWAPQAYSSTDVVVPIQERSFNSWTKKPEANIFVVRGMANGNLLQQIARNKKSIEGPRTHPDYRGYEIKVVYPPDASLNTQEAVDWATRIIYDAAGHAQKWCSFVAPLVFITDPDDAEQVLPRPLRINDQVEIADNNGPVPFLIRSCNPAYDRQSGGDAWQWAFYQCLYVGDAEEITF